MRKNKKPQAELPSLFGDNESFVSSTKNIHEDKKSKTKTVIDTSKLGLLASDFGEYVEKGRGNTLNWKPTLYDKVEAVVMESKEIKVEHEEDERDDFDKKKNWFTT
jgi:hypothetical protein